MDEKTLQNEISSSKPNSAERQLVARRRRVQKNGRVGNTSGPVKEISFPSKFRFFELVFVIAAVAIVSGCQPLWLRGDRNAKNFDDWETPQKSNYAQPRKYARPAASPNGEDAHSQVNKTPNDLKPTGSYAQDQKPKPLSTTMSAAQLTSKETDATVAVKNQKQSLPLQQTIDQELDLESVVAALPPNLREVFRQQVLATSQRVEGGTTIINPMVASAQPSTNEPTEINVGKTIISPPSVATAIKEQHDVIRVSLSDNNSQFNSDDKIAPASPSVVAASAIVPVTDQAVVGASNDQIKSTANQNSVSTAVVFEPSQTATAVAKSANEQTWQQSIDDSIVRLENSLSKTEQLEPRLRLRYEMALRLMYLSANRLNDALRPIDGLQPAEQEYYRHQLQALFASADPDAIPVASRRWATVMDSQRKATNKLAAISTLEVRGAAFCTDVQGYGVVTPFSNYLFRADQDVLLYCELENVAADEIKTGFETQLQGSYEIIDANGKRVVDQLLPMEKEICANHRRDYFVVYRIFMPVQIAPGNYQMRITIEDMKGKKFGQSQIDFQIQK